MKYHEWVSEHYPYLYEIYYHIILPERRKIQHDTASTLSFGDFCKVSYKTHGSGRV